MSSASLDGQGRLDFLEIDGDTVALLREFREHLLPALPGIVDDFYDKLAQTPELHRLLGSDQSVARLKRTQIGHWDHLFDAEFGDAYYRRALAIGEAHHRVNLSPRWYMGAYAVMLNHLLTVVERVYGNDPAKTRAMTAAINKVVFLDMELAISVYIEAMANQRYTEMARIADRLEADIQSTIVEVREQSGAVLRATVAMSHAVQRAAERSMQVASASEQASANVQTVASATEEMASSVREIGRQADQSKAITERAVNEAGRTANVVTSLTNTAQEIGKVLKLISDIAGQTNLLALNATIEAARAGDAGRGFAVVASEVKSLANETAKATDEIRNQIGNIQAAATETVSAIGSIQHVIEEVQSIAVGIADAVSEQSATTSEISRSIHEVATGTRDVFTNISDVARDTGEVDDLAADVRKSSQQAEAATVALQERVNRILEEIRGLRMAEQEQADRDAERVAASRA